MAAYTYDDSQERAMIARLVGEGLLEREHGLFRGLSSPEIRASQLRQLFRARRDMLFPGRVPGGAKSKLTYAGTWERVYGVEL